MKGPPPKPGSHISWTQRPCLWIVLEIYYHTHTWAIMVFQHSFAFSRNPIPVWHRHKVLTMKGSHRREFMHHHLRGCSMNMVLLSLERRFEDVINHKLFTCSHYKHWVLCSWGFRYLIFHVVSSDLEHTPMDIGWLWTPRWIHVRRLGINVFNSCIANKTYGRGMTYLVLNPRF